MYKPIKNRRDAEMRQMRDRALAVAMRRKEEYLGARVPKELKDRVMARATELGMPISILIRRVLEEAFGDDAARAAVATPAPAAHAAPDYSHVIAWKPIELNQERACDSCGKPMRAGQPAAIGFTQDGPFIIVCTACRDQP